VGVFTSVVERGEEPQAVRPVEQRPFDLHLAARQRLAGGEALRPRQELVTGVHLVSDHLQTLLLRNWSRADAVGLRGTKGGGQTACVYICIYIYI